MTAVVEGEFGLPATARRPVHLVMSDVMTEVGIIPKTRRTQGPGNYLFRGIEDVLAKLQPLLIAHSLLVLPEVIERIDLPGRVTDKGKALHAVALHVRYRVHGPAGDSLVFSAWGEGADSGDKATGKAMSMAYKSAMLQAFAVPTETVDDADRDDPSVEPEPPRTYTAAEFEAAGRALSAARNAPDLPVLLRVGSAANEQGLMGAVVEGRTLRAHLDERRAELSLDRPDDGPVDGEPGDDPS